MPYVSDSRDKMRKLQKLLFATFNQIKEHLMALKLSSLSITKNSSPLMDKLSNSSQKEEHAIFKRTPLCLVGYSSSASGDTRKGKELSRVDNVETRGPFGDYKIMMPVTWFEVEEDYDYAD
jgi:hypothetical protein